MAATVVLVHGAWHGAWCWEQVVPLLDAHGVTSVAIDLPGHGASTEPLGDLHGDAAALTALLDGLSELGQPVVVCGHSYGGAVISQGAGHRATRHLVYLAAFPLDVGESCMDAAARAVSKEAATSELGPALVFHDDGTITVDPGKAVGAFYDDCTPADAERAVARLGPQPRATLSQPASRAAWREHSSTYVVCEADRAVTPAHQRAMAKRAGAIIEWPTSHSPFLSRPQLVADLLAELATRD
jgi:pimeloyl-ACP methyl ester carboxylesterase